MKQHLAHLNQRAAGIDPSALTTLTHPMAGANHTPEIVPEVVVVSLPDLPEAPSANTNLWKAQQGPPSPQPASDRAATAVPRAPHATKASAHLEAAWDVSRVLGPRFQQIIDSLAGLHDHWKPNAQPVLLVADALTAEGGRKAALAIAAASAKSVGRTLLVLAEYGRNPSQLWFAGRSEARSLEPNPAITKLESQVPTTIDRLFVLKQGDSSNNSAAEAGKAQALLVERIRMIRELYDCVILCCGSVADGGLGVWSRLANASLLTIYEHPSAALQAQAASAILKNLSIPFLGSVLVV